MKHTLAILLIASGAFAQGNFKRHTVAVVVSDSISAIVNVAQDSVGWTKYSSNHIGLTVPANRVVIGTATDQSGYRFAIWQRASTLGVGFLFDASGTDSSGIFTAAGKFGIGTLTPAARLDVIGQGYFNSNIVCRSGLLVFPDGTQLVNGYDSASDRSFFFSGVITGGTVSALKPFLVHGSQLSLVTNTQGTIGLFIKSSGYTILGNSTDTGQGLLTVRAHMTTDSMRVSRNDEDSTPDSTIIEGPIANVVYGNATSGLQGLGTINAKGLYDDGVAVEPLTDGNDAFTTTATTDTVTVSGVSASSKYIITLTGVGAPAATDAVIVEVTASGFVLHRGVAGTSGLTYDWFHRP